MGKSPLSSVLCLRFCKHSEFGAELSVGFWKLFNGSLSAADKENLNVTTVDNGTQLV